MADILQVDQLSKEYKGFTLRDVNFCLPEGSVMGLIGENGAGKTTVIELILNLISRKSGKVTVFGLDNQIHEREIKEQLGVETVVSEAVRDHLAEKGFDENYGARPLRRVIQNEIEDAMAEEYLGGKFVQGDTVALEMNENHIKFVRK